MIGKLPDYHGIETAKKYVLVGGKNSSGEIYGLPPIILAASIAIQSQWYRESTDTHDGWLVPFLESSGFGIGQIGDQEIIDMGYQPGDQENPDIAVQAMAERISKVLNQCKNCTAIDKLVISALAQNGSGFTADDLKDVPKENGQYNWQEYFNIRNNSKPSSITAQIRQGLTNKQYDTQFMLLLMINDIRELHNQGYDLPWGLTLEDLDNFQNDLLNNLFKEE